MALIKINEVIIKMENLEAISYDPKLEKVLIWITNDFLTIEDVSPEDWEQIKQTLQQAANEGKI